MKKLLVILLFSVILFFTAGFAIASVTNGVIDASNKYAWAENAGWINFGCAKCNILITSSQVTGYAWSENFGWINLNPTKSGVKNNGSGVLSGSAWGENTGWIDFSGVTINSSGQFTGTAEGDIVGTVNFDCTSTGCPVTTDWRQVSCGDGTCNGTETCSVCSQDCGSCSGGTSGGYVQPKPLVLTVNSAYISSALDKNVILSGISTPEAEIIFSWDDKYGMIIVGSSGKWEANLGKMSVGNHSILLIAKNSAGDTKTLTVSVEVKEQQEKPLPAGRQEPANQNNKIRSLINLFFSKKSAPSSSFIIIPKEAPEVLKGEWNLLPIKVNNQ